MQLSAVDLNLLVVLGALLETASVKEAAVRLGLSPSATSHALGRLRDLLGDELLVRAGQSMVLTSRGQRLRPEVLELLQATRSLLSDERDFQPETVRRTFRISAVEYVDFVLLEPLSACLARLAPGLDLFAVHPGEAPERLRNGSLDLALGVFQSPPADVEVAELMRDRMVCVMRKGHPLATKRLTLPRYLSVPHVLTAPTGGHRAMVDDALEQMGKTRRVARTTTTFDGALRRVASTDYLVTMPERPASRLVDELNLVVRCAPLALPEVRVAMMWHRRQTDDPAHRWMRERLVEVARDQPAPPPIQRA